MDDVTPIILVGMNRSGTKWVSNLLCSHEAVIGAQSERSTGILETNMFGIMQDKFDLSYPDEYVGFLELWSKTELFKRTGISKETFYTLSPRPRNFLTLFELLMSEFARHNGRAYWLQKTSPIRAGAVLEYFRNARVVIVRRHFLDTLKSTVGLYSRDGSRKIIRSTYDYVYQRKILDQIARKYRVVEVQYETLKMQTTSEVERMCLELGLDPEKISVESPYQRNTSFASNSQRESIISGAERRLVKFMATVFSLVPLNAMLLLTHVKARLKRRKPLPFMPGSFGNLIDDLKDCSRGKN